MKQRTTRPGFVAGLKSVFAGVGFILRTPATWPWAMVPALVLIVLSGLLASGAVLLTRSVIEGWLGHPASLIGRAGASVLGWIGAVLAAVLGLLLAMALTPPLSSPALERIVGQVEERIDAPKRTPLGFFAEMLSGLKAQAVAALFAVPLLSILWLIEIFVSPAVFVTVPLKFLVSALCLAWNLFDYPLTLRGVRMRDRLRLVRAHRRSALGFGIGFAILFWLPCFGILMLPVGVAAATRLVWEILGSDPELLPELRKIDGDPQLPAQLEVPVAGHVGD